MIEGEKLHIKKAKKGNKEAFGLLYDYYLPKIYRYIFLKVSNEQEAEDLTHEVFFSAWRNMRGYKDEGFPFSSWLYRIAKNAVIDSYRTAKNNISLSKTGEDDFKVIDRSGENLDMDFQLEKIKKTIPLLRQDYQDVIIMRFVEDLSHEEIAGSMGKSEGAIRLIQHRALKELKDLYENGNTNGTIIKEV